MSDVDINKLESLDFEFMCIYNDGTKLKQQYGTPEEKSFKDINLDKLDEFVLTGSNKVYAVNLRNGAFYLNGPDVSFDLGVETKEDGTTQKIEPTKYRLIYFRRVRQDFAPTGITIKTRYCIGWQTTINNKNYQRLMFVSPDGEIIFANNK